MTAPAELETARLLLRRPRLADAASIYERYASDSEVTHFLGWPRHRTVADTEAFLRFSDEEWQRWPAGPYLILARAGGQLVPAVNHLLSFLENQYEGRNGRGRDKRRAA